MNIDNRIIEFIKKHHVLTLATSLNNVPWCANCFYAYLEPENLFVFSSDLGTRHIFEAQNNNAVAASIVLETRIIGKIQGLQVTGILSEPKAETAVKAKKRYLKRFPYAILTDTRLWVLAPSLIKMTDNRLGFGKKIIWKAEP
jgi:uncharacterized protein